LRRSIRRFALTWAKSGSTIAIRFEYCLDEKHLLRTDHGGTMLEPRDHVACKSNQISLSLD
jgi:hypothetical protein